MYTLHFISDNGDGTWSVYKELYRSRDEDEPIDGTQEWLSSHPTEAEADAEANRLQQEVL